MSRARQNTLIANFMRAGVRLDKARSELHGDPALVATAVANGALERLAQARDDHQRAYEACGFAELARKWLGGTP